MNLPEGPLSFKTRAFGNTSVGKLRGGKLVPVMADIIRPLEGGLVRQTVSMELDPMPGRLITPPTAEVICVFVPVQAIDAIKDPSAQYAGMTEVIRDKLLSGSPLFVLENEGEISKRCNIHPQSVAGQKKVNECFRLAHNAAVNFLRTRKYVKATTILHSNTALTPALIGNTVLDRMNGVLDPDDRINGAVSLDLPSMNLPVSGVAFNNAPAGLAAGQTVRQHDAIGNDTSAAGEWLGANTNTYVRSDNPGTPAAAKPDVFAVLNGTFAGNIGLDDFYNAQTMDRLTRTMEGIVKQYPEYGTEYVLRWAHGLQVDTGKIPIVLANIVRPFQTQIRGAMDADGVNDDVMRTDNTVSVSFAVPVPKTELGGVIMTFAVLKPDETLAAQPHPFGSEPWGLDNYVADQLALDPVPVTIRELDGDCLMADELTVAMYTGYNALKRSYRTYGFSRFVDPLTVENKSQIWQLEIPVSVTPDNILYPATLDHAPFALDTGSNEVCTYRCDHVMAMRTPIVFGPTPVETVDVIDDEDIFEQVP